MRGISLSVELSKCLSNLQFLFTNVELSKIRREPYSQNMSYISSIHRYEQSCSSRKNKSQIDQEYESSFIIFILLDMKFSDYYRNFDLLFINIILFMQRNMKIWTNIHMYFTNNNSVITVKKLRDVYNIRIFPFSC